MRIRVGQPTIDLRPIDDHRRSIARQPTIGVARTCADRYPPCYSDILLTGVAMRSWVVLLGWACSFAATSARADAGSGAGTPEDRYQGQALGVRDLTTVRRDGTVGNRQHWLLPDGPWDAFQGADHHPIDDEAFFRIVGREDLLRRYQHKSIVKKSLTYGGGALLVGGLLFAGAVAALRGSGDQTLYLGSASPHSPGPSPMWGLAVAGAGFAAVIAGHLLDPRPIDADTAEALARDYGICQRV
jgi:hypothetical protein